jgi:uncharacterized protein YbgA (DUF1722 family)/uncharacterized protein YbbK (DUF523 family)
MNEKIPLGVSACLMGEKVRYDASHKYNPFINLQLSNFFSFVPICPEVGIGLGVPRKTLRLVEYADGVHAVGVMDDSLDVTERLNNYLPQVAPRLAGICGYILKKGSPSCGMERVKIYHPNGMPNSSGAGLYAQSLMAQYPLLPVEEEGRLNDPPLRENFITRVFVYHRWQHLQQDKLTAARLIDFHTRHKLLVMSHNQAAYRRLGQLVAGVGKSTVEALAADYIALLMETLKRRATPKSHTNVLQHLMGYLKKQLDSEDKQELLETFDAYRNGRLPLVVPITLLKHHFRKHPAPYVADQVYLDPHPAELMLRNMV